MQIFLRAILSLTIVVVLAAGVPVIAQQPTNYPGVELYKQGKIDEAIAVLESAKNSKQYASNGEVWNFLGLAYFAKSDLKQARKAFEKAVKLSPAIAAFHGNLAYIYLLLRKIDDARSQANETIRIEPTNTNAYFILGRSNLWENKLDEADKNALQIIAIDPGLPAGYILRSNALISRLGNHVEAGWDVIDYIDLLKQANDILQIGVVKCRANPNHKDVDDEAESISAFYAYFNKNQSSPVNADIQPEPSITPLRILRKPLPPYSDGARQAGVSGTITLVAIFGADARIKYVLLLKRLGYGLDEMAELAARQITFVPQKKDGKPVSTAKMLEYSFSIY